jgi:hypothetical protein
LVAGAVPVHGQVRPLPKDVGPVLGGGGFVIQSCGETGSAEGWTETVNNAPSHVATGINCPPSNLDGGGVYQQAGLWVTERLGRDGGTEAVPGDRAELAFSALAGTTITRVRWYREVFKNSDNSWHQYTALDSSGNVVDECDYDAHVDTVCAVGDVDWHPNDGNFDYNSRSYADLQNLAATRVIAGLTCRDFGPPHVCGGGFSLVNAEVQIFSAFFTIADGDAPDVGTPSGDAWTTNAYVNGTVPVTLSSTDLTGIRETRAYVDGQLVATTPRSCSYTRPRPCTDEPGATVDVPTGGLADGPHTLQVAAVDAAGNETRVTRSTPLRVDNQAPAAPVGLSSPAATSQTNDFEASWALPADQGVPIVAARYQLCQASSCGPVQTAPSLTAVSGLALPAPGIGTLRVWLVDASAHENAAAPATLTLTYAPPLPPPPSTQTPSPPPTTTPTTTTPAPPPPPPLLKAPAKLKLTTLRRAGRTVTIAGTLTAKASGRVTIRYRVRSHGKTHTLSKRVTIRRHAFRTSLRLTPTYAAQRTATVTVSYAGDADTAPQSRTTTLHTRA